MIKNRFVGKTCLFLGSVALLGLTACSAPNAGDAVYSTPEPLIDVVDIDPNDVVAWDYESFDDGMKVGSFTIAGQGEYHEGYRGVLTLSEQAVQDYELTAGDEVTIYGEYDLVDPSAYSSHWYYCDNIYYVFSTDWEASTLYFDGKDKVVFWISEGEN